MTKPFAILAAAISIICGSSACSSSITAEPWYPRKSRTDAAKQAHASDAASDAGDEDEESDAGE